MSGIGMSKLSKLDYLFYATQDGASCRASVPLVGGYSYRGALPPYWLSHKFHKVTSLSFRFSRELAPFYLFLCIPSLLRNMDVVFYSLIGLLLICLDTFLCSLLFFVGCFYSIPAFFHRSYSYFLRSTLGAFGALFQSESLNCCVLLTQEFFLYFVRSILCSRLYTSFVALRKKIRSSLSSIFDTFSFKADHNLCT